ncbi:uncharacterized protein TNCV_1149201 [Trichonephila clavipes]|nr:uncharacterized protein TNCV_1149201 [Trichonephila clavipes]
MAPHKPRKSATIDYTTDDENLIMYDVEEEELEPDPTDKFAITEYHRNNPEKYIRALTPTRFRKNLFVEVAETRIIAMRVMGFWHSGGDKVVLDVG